MNFPHLAKNARYGAPEFVAGRNPKLLFSRRLFNPGGMDHPSSWQGEFLSREFFRSL
jgi:hypothetical protein